MAEFASGQLMTAAALNGIGAFLLASGQQAYISTLETTTSLTYADLTTVGPSVTVTSAGTTALVFISADLFSGGTHLVNASVAVSGATTLTATTVDALGLVIGNQGTVGTTAATFQLLDINVGTNTYKMQYKNSGTQTGDFAQRKLIVIAP